jgi:hypothetical protein
MNLLDASQVRFEQPEGKALSLRLANGTFHESVACVRLFPLSDPGHFISVCETSGTACREIGIIPDLSALEPLQRELVMADIRFRYFVPEITDILNIAGKRGSDTWEVATDRGKKTFIVQDRNENVSITDSGVVFVVDVDKCRYTISNYQDLPKRARLLLEKNLL